MKGDQSFLLFTDREAFDKVFDDAQKTATLPRSQQYGTKSMEKFVEVRYGDSTIGISAEKARELYGDGKPEIDDNKLGWVPNIEEQYEAALQSGSDITVPIKTWDERLTSAQANRFLIEGNVRRQKRKEKVDKMAAAILLQSYLDSLVR